LLQFDPPAWAPFDVRYQNDTIFPVASLVTSLNLAHALGSLVSIPRTGANHGFAGMSHAPWCCAQRWLVTMVAWGQVQPPMVALGILNSLCLPDKLVGSGWSRGGVLRLAIESLALRRILRHMQLRGLQRLRGKVTRTIKKLSIACPACFFYVCGVQAGLGPDRLCSH